MKTYYVYMITNWDNRVLYTGVTNDIERRTYEHKSKSIKGFSSRYNLDRLVYVEETPDIKAGQAREKQIKGWRREKKNALVAITNPEWKDLSNVT